jgi:hypothetical protein
LSLLENGDYKGYGDVILAVGLVTIRVSGELKIWNVGFKVVDFDWWKYWYCGSWILKFGVWSSD